MVPAKYTVEKQVAIIFLGVNGYLDDIPTSQLRRLELEYYQFLESNHPDLLKDIAEKKNLDDELRKRLESASGEFLKMFSVEE